MAKVENLIEFAAKVQELTLLERIDTPLRVHMIQMREVFKEILHLMNNIVGNELQDNQIMVDYFFVTLQSFREFYLINELDPTHCHGTEIQIKDHLQDVIDQTIPKIKEGIVKTCSRLTPFQRKATFPNVDDIADYIKFFEEFI